MRFYFAAIALAASVGAYTLSGSSSRRAFFNAAPATIAAAATASQMPTSLPALAAPEIKTTNDGKIKYAVVKTAQENGAPIKGDIVAIGGFSTHTVNCCIYNSPSSPF